MSNGHWYKHHPIPVGMNNPFEELVTEFNRRIFLPQGAPRLDPGRTAPDPGPHPERGSGGVGEGEGEYPGVSTR